MLRALSHHGFAAAIVFSAHGGNATALATAAAAWQTAGTPMAVHVVGNLDAVTRRLHTEAARFGVAAEAAGHHAGEIETSIMLALHPELVRMDAAEAGVLATPEEASALFYPDLRRHAPIQ